MATEHQKKDPRGLVRNDLDHLKRVFKQRPVTPKQALNDIMFQGGIQSVLDYIEREMVAKR